MPRGFAKVLSLACDDAMRNLGNTDPNVNDVFQADFVKTFRWNDSKLFIDRPDGEGRLLFSLFLDFFNVEEMCIRGASTSSGVIAMACLNLPVDIRYKPENIYISGIIPGPKEPSLTEINHFIAPLVDDLKAAWDRGVVFSHAPNRLVRSRRRGAPVCDLLGGSAAGLLGKLYE